MINAPATAKELMSIPMRFKISSPKNKNPIIMTQETIDAFPDWMCPTFFRSDMMIGMFPMISITAKRIIPAVKISLTLMLIVFFAKVLFLFVIFGF
jgi:hypothetical protein